MPFRLYVVLALEYAGMQALMWHMGVGCFLFHHRPENPTAAYVCVREREREINLFVPCKLSLHG